MNYLALLIPFAISFAASNGKSAPNEEIEAMSTNVRIDTGHTDPNPHYVDIKALRQMSIDAYMKGGNYDDLEKWGVSRRDMSLALCFTILIFASIMTCCCFQCQKHLMREFYKLESTARREAEAAAAAKYAEEHKYDYPIDHEHDE